MRHPLLLLLLVPAACAGAPPAPSGPGRLQLSVEQPNVHPARATEVWLRDAAGATAFGFLGRDDTIAWQGLEPGSYALAAKVGFAPDGPWIYVSDVVVVRAGEATAVRFALPRERNARLEVRPEAGAPPFYLVLAEPGTEFPGDMRALQERLAQQRYPEGLVFAMQSDGRSGLEDLPALRPGRHVLLVVANDWQPTDPLPMGRTSAVELRAGKTTTVRLLERLTRIVVE